MLKQRQIISNSVKVNDGLVHVFNGDRSTFFFLVTLLGHTNLPCFRAVLSLVSGPFSININVRLKH